MRIQSEIIEQMVDHAFGELPNECCGLLSGGRGIVDGIRRCTNERSSPSDFSVPPRELLAFFRTLREQGREFLGIYHSHPEGSPGPSSRDEAEFHYRGTSYWIVSLNNGLAGVRCFQWKQRGFVEISFEVGGEDGLGVLPFLG